MANDTDARNPDFVRAVEAIGGYTKLADALGLTKANVWNWGSIDRRVPAEHVLAVENLCGGIVTRHQLRPDVFGVVAEPVTA